MFIPPKNIPHNNMVASFRGSPASAGASDYPEFYFFGYPERSSQEPLSTTSQVTLPLPISSMSFDFWPTGAQN